MAKKKTIIGREDSVDFPGLGLSDIKVKVDTGAFTSAIHCSIVEEKREGETTYIEFRLFDVNTPEIFKTLHRTEQYEKRIIKSSNGNSEERFVIQTDVTIFGESYLIELSLTDRSKMNFPILLGRRFISNLFVVDSRRTNLSFKQKNKPVVTKKKS